MLSLRWERLHHHRRRSWLQTSIAMILCSCRWSLFEINFYMQFLPRLRRLEEDLFHHERHSAEIFCDWLHSQIWMWDHNMAGFFSFCLLVQKCSSSLWCLPFDVLSRNVVPFLERERERERIGEKNEYLLCNLKQSSWSFLALQLQDNRIARIIFFVVAWTWSLLSVLPIREIFERMKVFALFTFVLHNNRQTDRWFWFRLLIQQINRQGFARQFCLRYFSSIFCCKQEQQLNNPDTFLFRLSLCFVLQSLLF